MAPIKQQKASRDMANTDGVPFKEGDEVQHKTGGPKMIYVGDDMIGRAICTWMAGNQKQSETFSHAELKPHVEPAAWSGRIVRV